jgi:hypothetical protein
MVALRRVLSFGVLLSAGVGCGLFSSHSKDSSGSNDSSLDSEILVLIENHHWSDIVIYLMDGSQSQRLGMVAGLSDGQFTFPFRKLTTGGNVRLRAYAVGGSGSTTSDDLRIQPGQGVKWILESDLGRSSLSVF